MSELFETGRADSTVGNTAGESRCNGREIQGGSLAWLAILIISFDGRVIQWQGVGGMSIAKDTSAVSTVMFACSQVEFDLTRNEVAVRCQTVQLQERVILAAGLDGAAQKLVTYLPQIPLHRSG
jgi:hypothetical protein